MLSASDIFAASAALFLALIVVVWMAHPSLSGAKADTGGAHRGDGDLPVTPVQRTSARQN